MHEKKHIHTSSHDNKGRRWATEWSLKKDRQTGVEIRQLTNYKGHSHHLYFTNPGWYADNTKLLFGSDREGRTNLFSLDLRDGAITQLTDLEMPPPPAETSFLFTCVNPKKHEAYFWHGRLLKAINLDTFDEHVLYESPPNHLQNMINSTADGRFVCTVIYEDLSSKFGVDLLHGYIGFREYWQAMPHSQILKIATDGSGVTVAFEENYWIGHINTSPTQPNLLSFCHEGPWNEVDQRIWGLDHETGKAWKIRPSEKGEAFGHEYWLADGVRVGYHGRTKQGEVFGIIGYDNSQPLELPFPRGSTHFYSNDEYLIVGDGSTRDPYIYLWKKTADGYTEPRRLLWHRCSFHTQQTHVHPRFTPDGKQILYTSDHSGYGNLYLAAVPNFESLPQP